jgi:pimeloyl-ACP methyl ester carboxylesterase
MAGGLHAKRLLILATWLAIGSGVAAAAEPKQDPGRLPGIASLPLPTLGGMQFWGDELFFQQWRIQRNVFTQNCRLLDENDFCYASGSFEQCLARLDEIKRERHLPPMKGKAVIVLHGLCRSPATMSGLCKYLREKGHYTVFNVGYPSTQAGIGEQAKSLAKIVANLEGIEEINFVAHSLGNLVIRHYLADRTEAAGGRPDPRFHRFVVLGPPNHAAIAATALAGNPLFAAVTGVAGRQLGRDWDREASHLATPTFEFGIIAGGRGGEKGYNPLLPGDNDGVVTVASMRLPGAADFTLVPVLHLTLVSDARVREYTLSFLQNGYFLNARKRQPIPAN